MNTTGTLANFMKYCLGYIRLTRQKTLAAQQRNFVILEINHFDAMALLGRKEDSIQGEAVHLNVFYRHDPKHVPPELQAAYDTEKGLANKLEDIYNHHENDSFTKEVRVNFGYFELELPLEPPTPDLEGGDPTPEEETPARLIKDRFPLFSLISRIEKTMDKGVGRYSVLPVETEVAVNAGMLEKILDENLYFQLLERLGEIELNGGLQLPLECAEIFQDIWHLVKAQLKLGDAHFDEQSFSLTETRIALSPRSNYFLAEDLLKLSKLPSETLIQTSLQSWVSEEGLNNMAEPPQASELYFPFSFDKYKVRVLSLLSNTAAIVEGPPGTGKSETIANLLCHLAATGKRVLFVSQKTQALKVVKDRLKDLDLPYLFGYIPNPGSRQSTEEDERDGIAARLTALDNYLQRLEHQREAGAKADVPAACAEQKVLRDALNQRMEDERRYVQLVNERETLKPFLVAGIQEKAFAVGFSAEAWTHVTRLSARIGELDQTLATLRAKSNRGDQPELTRLTWSGRRWSDAVGLLRDDVQRTGYDRRSGLIRRLNNTLRQIRCRGIRAELPRELIERIDAALALDQSRAEALHALEAVHELCRWNEAISERALVDHAFQQKLFDFGATPELYAPLLAVIQGPGQGDPLTVKTAVLRLTMIDNELSKLESSAASGESTAQFKAAETRRRERVIQYMATILNSTLVQRCRQGVRVRQIIARLAKAFGKSRKAFKTFDSLRKDPENFKAVLDLIPVWIMELDDASRVIPLESNLFDYVLLDEASQCNVAYTLPTMFRARRAVFVGDSEQMRDNTIMFKSNKAFDELAHRYQIPADLQIKATGAAVQSVLDIARLRGLQTQALQYHYRSPAELIGFSNHYFYQPKGKDLITLNYNYLTYLDTGRIMVIHNVAPDLGEEIADNANLAEVRAILACFRKLREDPRTTTKSVGILTFFNAQAACLRHVFEENGLKEERDNFKISIIEGIQGDEKDIVLYSFVIRDPSQKRKYVSLTGESGDIQADINKGRVNVAFSRARLQVHCFISLPSAEFPDKIWIKRYLNYVEENGLVRHLADVMQPFDSYFEQEFYDLLRQTLNGDYRIRNQVKSCGFKIDFVVHNTKTGRSLAIECDGPTHFRDEIDEAYGVHVESDEERQSVLEDAGWWFYRIKYSDWLREGQNRKNVVEEIESILGSSAASRQPIQR